MKKILIFVALTMMITVTCAASPELGMNVEAYSTVITNSNGTVMVETIATGNGQSIKIVRETGYTANQAQDREGSGAGGDSGSGS